MMARPRTPRVARKLYRAGCALLEQASASRRLPQSLLDECRMCASRSELLARLPKGGVVAELGTYRGEFARNILEIAAPKVLHVVDITFAHFDTSLLSDARIVRHQGLTHQVMAGFPDRHFDWIYVDAGHSYEDCLRDAEVSAAKLSPNGFLVFNDFAHVDLDHGRYGVHRAVVDFALEKRWPMRYFAMHPAALYDVALQKPEA